MPDIGPLYPLMYEPIVRRALEEDLGLAGDVTSDTVVPRGRLRPRPAGGAPTGTSCRAAGGAVGLPHAVSATGDRRRPCRTAPTSA